MGILSKHLGMGEPITIGEDTINLYPLTTEDLPLFFKAMKAFSGAKEGASPEDIFKNLNDEGLNAIKILIDKTLDKSLPNEPIEDRRSFGLKYMMTLFPKIMEINMSMDTHEAVKKKDLIEAIKNK